MLKNKKFVTLLLIIGIVFIISSILLEDQKYDTLDGLLIGYGCGLFGMSVACFFNIRFEEKNPEEAKTIAVEYSDERNTAIRNRAKAKAADIIQLSTLLCISFLVILFSESTWIIIALVLSFVIYQALVLTFMNKYNQEM